MNFGLARCENKRQKPKECIDIQGGLNQLAFCVVWGMFEPFANGEGEDGKWDYGAIEM